MLTYKQALNESLDKLLVQDKRVYVLGEDICDPYGGAFKVTKGLSQKYPGRLISTPISEAGITGIGIGMALRGLRPIVEIMFGDFIALAADQIITNLSKLSWMYNGLVSLPIVIRVPMGGRRGYGPTHSQCLEKIFMGIPNIKIVAPSFCHDVGSLLSVSVYDDEPVLFIENKIDYARAIVHDSKSYEGWSIRTTNSRYPSLHCSLTGFNDAQITVLVYGGMAGIVLDALKELLVEEEIVSHVIIPSLIKPFDVEEVVTSVKETGKLVVAEEGTISWGWGAEVAARVSEKAFRSLKLPVRRVAASDVPIGSASDLEDAVLPSGKDVKQVVREMYEGS